MNTATQIGRRLRRTDQVKGPFRITRTLDWLLKDKEGNVLPAFEEKEKGELNETYERMLSTKSDQCTFVTVNQVKHIFCCENRKKDKPYLIDVARMERLEVVKKEMIKKWDFLRTLVPPNDLSLESGNIFRLQNIPKSEPDYEFVAS